MTQKETVCMRFRLGNIRTFGAGIVLVLAQALALHAQVNSATLLGTVKDSSGAAVPEATITVKSADTGQERTAKTDGAGNYTVSNLQGGRYQLTVAAPGFKTAMVTVSPSMAYRSGLRP